MEGNIYIYMFISSFMALFPVMNPISSGIITNSILQDLEGAQRRRIIKKILINCLGIGIGSLVAGHLILLVFNLAIPVVQLGGGILICKTGLEWLSESGGSMKAEKKQEAMDDINIAEIESKVFYPISFPLSIGPGSISVIFTLMATATSNESWITTGLNYILIVLAIVAVLAILYIFLSQGQRLMKRLGSSGNLIINKLVAFFTFCIGIQIIVTGISKIFHLTIL